MRGYEVPPMHFEGSRIPEGWLDVARVVWANLSPWQEDWLKHKCRWEQRALSAITKEYGIPADPALLARLRQVEINRTQKRLNPRDVAILGGDPSL
jgi:hypothetical protein